MELFIVRHAWAGQAGDPAWPDDSQRPLSDEGRERFAAMVEKLAAAGVAPGIIATSPMVRCVQTAELLAEGSGGDPRIVRRDELLPGGHWPDLLDWTGRHAGHHEQVAWVSHAPDVAHMTTALIGRSGAAIRFAKGAIAKICFDGPPAFAAGELCWLITGKVLGV
jgi:phosphohistidine phosphatase